MAENTYLFYSLTFIFTLGIWIYLPACTSVYHMHAMPVETIRGHQISGTGVTHDCKQLYGCWE